MNRTAATNVARLRGIGEISFLAGMSHATEFAPGTLAALSWSGRTGGAVKRLSGFRKDHHTVPTAVNAATQAFLGRLCADELAAEAEQWFQRAKESFGYKRRDLTLDLAPASAVLTAKNYSFELAWTLDESDPANYTITRTLRQVRDAEFVRQPACDAVFAGTFTQLVFTLARGVAVEAVIDAVESLPAPATMTVRYPANCAECTLSVPDVAAEVRCTGAALELIFPCAGSPRELIEAFGEVRAAFRFTQDAALAALL